jgi:hypothetical protein
MKIYIRVELSEEQLKKLGKKTAQPMEELKDTPPKVVI